MNKTVIITTIAIIVLIGSALTYALVRPEDETQVQQDVSVVPSSTTTADEEDAAPLESEPASTLATQPGAYVDYSEAAVESATGTKLLFFHATWCSQCIAMEANINESGVPDGVTVFKVDYDSNQALRQQYGITLQTTFVKIDDSGNKIASYTPYEDPVFSVVERELL